MEMNPRDLPDHLVMHGPPMPPKLAARRLTADTIRGEFTPEALHTYTDRHGRPHYWRIRARLHNGEKWIRPMSVRGMVYALMEPEELRSGVKPLYRLHEIANADPGKQVWFVEGERCADALARLELVATTAGGTGSDEAADFEPLRGRHLILWPDNDQSGREHIQRVAAKLGRLGCTVETIDIDQLALPDHGDAADYLAAIANPTAADLLALARVPVEPAVAVSGDVWPEPRPIIAELRPVPIFDTETLLPVPLRAWIVDEAERMPCPPEFIAAAVLVALGSIIGARCAIRPKARDSWLIVPNLWGGIVGDPSAKKSPAWSAALAPIDKLIAKALEEHSTSRANYDTAKVVFDAQKDAIENRIKAAAREPNKGDPVVIAQELHKHGECAPEAPTIRRYKTNDSTVEKLGELLRENARGLLVLRDELVGLIATWEREGREGERAFFLEAWNGNQSFDTDRIGRGHISIPNLCVSIFGGIQPDKLTLYLEQATHALANDGMLQRFQLLVYPNPRRWEWRDRLPDKGARAAVDQVFGALADFDPVTWGAVPADDWAKFPWFSFDEAAQLVFVEWSGDLHIRRIPDEDEPIIRQHLAKFDKLFPALALIFHLIGCAIEGARGQVNKEAALRAAAWCEFLEAHARRCYGLLMDDGLRAAQALAAKVKSGGLVDSFTLRDVRRNQWRDLTRDGAIQAALDWLEDEHWLKSESSGGTGPGSGRRTVRYRINPAVEVRAKEKSR
jgi:hypothetical protein